MYRKEDVLRKLNADNYYIDVRALDNFITEWQIDPIYEAKDGTVFFDDVAIQKIKKGDLSHFHLLLLKLQSML